MFPFLFTNNMSYIKPNASEIIEFIESIIEPDDLVSTVNIHSDIFSGLVTERPSFINEEIFNKYFLKNPDLPIHGVIETGFLVNTKKGYLILISRAYIGTFVLIKDEDPFNGFVHTQLRISLAEFSHIVTQKCAINGIEKIDKFYEVARSIYGEDRVEVCLSNRIYSHLVFRNNMSNSYLTIHYPEVIVEDEDGVKLKIHDIYVTLSFRESGGINHRLYGARTRITYHEAASQYQHSHLEMVSVLGRRTAFCLGDGSVPGAFNIALAEGYDEMSLYNLFFTIDAFLKWEDEEGVPYKRIKDTYLKQHRNAQMGYKELVDQVVAGYIPVRTNIDDGQLHVNILERDIVSATSRNGFGYKSKKGTIYLKETLNPDPSNIPMTCGELVFKEKVIPCEIAGFDEHIDLSAMETNMQKVNASMPNKATIALLEERIKEKFYTIRPQKVEFKSYESKYNIPETLIALKKIQRSSQSNTF